jgi:hypothetical protein
MGYTKNRVMKASLVSALLMLMFSMMLAHALPFKRYMVLTSIDGGSLVANIVFPAEIPGTFIGDMNVRMGTGGLSTPGQLLEKKHTTMRVWGGWGSSFIVPGFFSTFSNRFPGELYLEAANPDDLLLCYGVTMPTPEVSEFHNNRSGSLCLFKWAEDGITAYPVDTPTGFQANGFMLSLSSIDDTGEWTIISTIGYVEHTDENPHSGK